MNSPQILSSEELSKIQPLGMNLTVLEEQVLEGNITRILIVEVSHPCVQKEMQFSLSLPVFQKNVIQWRTTKKALMYNAYVNVESDFDILTGNLEETKRMRPVVNQPHDIARQRIEKAISDALRPWFFEAEDEVDRKSIQVTVDSWFSSGPEWRVLKYSRIAQESQNFGIIIDPASLATRHNERVLSKIFNNDLYGAIDPTSPSVGDKINESFRLVDGAIVKDSKLIPSTSYKPFCRVTERHAIGLSMNHRRAYLARTTFESAIDLSSPEEPLVTPYDPDEQNPLQ